MAKPRQSRDTYKYHLKQGNRTVHKGITTDWKRREQEHQQEFPGSKLKRIGHRTTREKALEWEHKGGKGR